MSSELQLCFLRLVRTRFGAGQKVSAFELSELRAFGREPHGGRALLQFAEGRRGDSMERTVQRIVDLVGRGFARFDRGTCHYAGGGVPEGAAELEELAGEVVETQPRHEIVIEVVGEDDLPLAGVAYEVELPGGSVRRGRVDALGRAAIRDLPDAGECKVCLPELDADAWQYLQATPI